MRAVALLAFAGCATAGSPLSNVATRAIGGQPLHPLVVDNFAGCTAHRVIVAIDAALVATVAITCPPPPPPLPGRRVVIVTDGPRTFDAPAVAIAPGRHTIVVRDELTGRTAELSALFPATQADTILVIDSSDELVVRVERRASLILL